MPVSVPAFEDENIVGQQIKEVKIILCVKSLLEKPDHPSF